MSLKAVISDNLTTRDFLKIAGVGTLGVFAALSFSYRTDPNDHLKQAQKSYAKAINHSERAIEIFADYVNSNILIEGERKDRLKSHLTSAMSEIKIVRNSALRFYEHMDNYPEYESEIDRFTSICTLYNLEDMERSVNSSGSSSSSDIHLVHAQTWIDQIATNLDTIHKNDPNISQLENMNIKLASLFMALARINRELQ